MCVYMLGMLFVVIVVTSEGSAYRVVTRGNDQRHPDVHLESLYSNRKSFTQRR